MIEHLAIIMDGNRRWARKQALHPWKGHEKGVDTLECVLDFCTQKNIFEISLYSFSLQNFKRNKTEVDCLLSIIKKSLQNPKYIQKFHDNQVHVRFLGRLHLFDTQLQALMKNLEDATKGYSKHKLNFCIGYGGREEITDAMKRIAEEVEQGMITSKHITQEIISSHLLLQSEPDIVIRTGGAMRTSNFLPWQSIYSEWFFIPEKWPEVTPEILETLFSEFNSRDRRFGE